MELISKFGYFGLFLAMILEAVIIIIPSELVLATGGILSSYKIFNFWISFFIGLLGSVFCAVIIYMMGRIGGRPFIEKYGKYFFMKKEDIEKSEVWFNKYGMIACLVGRNFPIIRTLISLPVGMMKLDFKKFFIYTLIGSIPWTFIFTYAGYQLGKNWIVLKDYTSRLKGPIILLISLFIIWWLFKKIFRGDNNGNMLCDRK